MYFIIISDDKIITGGKSLLLSLLKESLFFSLKLLVSAIKALLFKSGLQKPNSVQVTQQNVFGNS